jgi:hypothetical protein
MRINMRELEQMLPVDVRVQINPVLPGSVSYSLLTTWCPGIPVHLLHPFYIQRRLERPSSSHH